jgi:hypothetical protein
MFPSVQKEQTVLKVSDIKFVYDDEVGGSIKVVAATAFVIIIYIASLGKYFLFVGLDLIYVG